MKKILLLLVLLSSISFAQQGVKRVGGHIKNLTETSMQMFSYHGGGTVKLSPKTKYFYRKGKAPATFEDLRSAKFAIASADEQGNALEVTIMNPIERGGSTDPKAKK